MMGPVRCVMGVVKRNPYGSYSKFRALLSSRLILVYPLIRPLTGVVKGLNSPVKVFRLKEYEHVISCNLMFEGGRGHDVDGIQIKPNSSHIWIDHCSLSNFDNGLIDITRGSTKITISRCHFANHDKTMFIGADSLHTVIDASALLFIIVSSTGPDRDIRMSDPGKYDCIIITLGIREFMPFAPV
ncbi:probable pectate lyase 13 [Phtheirospermum japonicum]|uniref:Probable pectate lyase 13 n=1 Tax=Phtheirospermum japonicum TaxID=374723 RepID=A0A830C9F6_9LAMI|nr:probable pectate lyase 13 [Phtheirospermum japonicum]